MEKAYGVGGLDERIVLQKVHAYSDWQDAFRHKNGVGGLKYVLTKACEYVTGRATKDVTKELLKLLQEPIAAVLYVRKLHDIIKTAVSASNTQAI